MGVDCEDPLIAIVQMEKRLSEITDICFDFFLPEFEVINPADYSPICQMLHTTEAGKAACQRCTQYAIDKALRGGAPVIAKCHIGLIDVYVPLIKDGRNVGILVCGQFLFTKPSRETYSEMRRQFSTLGLYLEEEAMQRFSVNIFPEKKVKALTAMMTGFGAFLSAAERQFERAMMESSMKPLDRAKAYIDIHYSEDLTIESVSACCNISSSRLSHLFKSALGLTFTKYLNGFRLEKARNLIVGTELPVSRIAEQVGFISTSHFNHLFRGAFLATPSSLREQNRTI